jgi:hypothetical protein
MILTYTASNFAEIEPGGALMSLRVAREQRIPATHRAEAARRPREPSEVGRP